MTRDPRSDPQPGDRFQGKLIMRRVIMREDARILVSNGTKRHWMSLDRWREWCEKSGAEAASAGVAGAGAQPPRRGPL